LLLDLAEHTFCGKLIPDLAVLAMAATQYKLYVMKILLLVTEALALVIRN
jgi:hypothetical protein